MNDKQLADALVEAGIGRYDIDKYMLWPPGADRPVPGATAFVNDWRVAGACLEAMAANATDPQLDSSGFMLRTLASPRAIIKAFTLHAV